MRTRCKVLCPVMLLLPPASVLLVGMLQYIISSTVTCTDVTCSPLINGGCKLPNCPILQDKFNANQNFSVFTDYPCKTQCDRWKDDGAMRGMAMIAIGGAVSLLCGIAAIYIIALMNCDRPDEQLRITIILDMPQNTSNSSMTQDTCSICLEPLDPAQGNVRITRPCRHAFHIQCISTWTLQKKLCPNCNTPLPAALPRPQ